MTLIARCMHSLFMYTNLGYEHHCMWKEGALVAGCMMHFMDHILIWVSLIAHFSSHHEHLTQFQTFEHIVRPIYESQSCPHALKQNRVCPNT